MLKTLLLDLDGTLLDLPVDIFLDRYMQRLAPEVADLVDPREFPDLLWASTRAMVVNNEPHRTNFEVFVDDFIRRSGVDRDLLWERLGRFYHETFPTLREHARFLPAAPRLIEHALERGLEVVIATNPIFPRVAIEERLRWAGVADYPYRLVTVLEEMHFCKPNPAYYEEILALLDRKPQECLMAGNDVEEDLVAGDVGMRTFLVDEFMIHRGKREVRADGRGDLDALWRFVDRLLDGEMTG